MHCPECHRLRAAYAKAGQRSVDVGELLAQAVGRIVSGRWVEFLKAEAKAANAEWELARKALLEQEADEHS